MKKALKVFAIVILTLLILVGVLIWGITTPFGQNFLTTQANSFLRKKLKTKVNIEKVRFDIPDWVLLEGVYFEDQHGDTLVAGKRLYVDLDMFSLIKGNVGINKIEVEGVVANINRVLPDTTFNFQFIVDAFAGTDTTTVADTTTSDMEMRLDRISLKNVRLSYRDAVIGTDAAANIDSAVVKFDKFNPSKSQYHPTTVALLNSQAKVRMYNALKVAAAAPPPEPETSDSLDLKLGDIDIQGFKWEFTDETSGLKNGITVGKLAGHINQLFMESQQVDVKNLALENMQLYAEFAKKAKEGPKEAIKDTVAAAATDPGWHVKVGDIRLVNNDIRYDDFNSPALPKGMDFAHLNIKDLNIALQNFLFSPENIAGALTSGSFSEKSGFKLEEFHTNFAYGEKETYLRNLLVRTPGTTLRDELSLRYNSLDDLTKNIAKVKLKLRLTDSRVAFADVLLLAPDLAKTPPFDTEPNGVLKGSGTITGSVDDMLIQNARFSMLSGTILAASGRVQGLPDPNKLNMDLTINEISSTKRDLMKMLPDSAVPASIELPENLKITGKVKGSMENVTLTTTINTSFGTGTFSGTLKNITDSLRAQYNGTLAFNDFDLGKLTKQSPAEMGKLTLRTDLQGVGYAPSSMKARLDGTIASADIKGYVYNNLRLKGDVDHGNANISADIADQNIDLNLTAQADLSKEFPSVKANVSIDNLDLNALKLYQDSLQIKGNIAVDMPSTNPANPLGTVTVNGLRITHHRRPMDIPDMTVALTDSNNLKQATINAPFLKARMEGNYVYTELGDAVLTEVGKHFKSPALTYKEVTKPVNFTFDATLTNHPLIQTFVPQLRELNPVTLHAEMDNQKDSSIVAKLTVPVVDFDSIRTERVLVDFSNVEDNVSLNAFVGSVNTGGFVVQNASLQSKMVDNNVKFDFVVRDSVNTDRHAIKAQLAMLGNRYRLNLREGLLLDYRQWETDTAGYISYAPDSLYIKDFVIKSREQSLTVNSTSEAPNSPLDIALANINISEMAAIAIQDSTMASGTLNGKILLSNYMVAPVYTGELTIDSLALTQIPVGNLSLKSTNETENLIRVDMALVSGVNEVNVDGSYNLKSDSPMDFTLDLKKLSGKTVEAFSMGQLQRAEGNLTGQVAITGSTTSPRLNGAINFDGVAFNATQLGSRYSLANQKIQFNDQNIVFNNFVIADSLNQQMKIDGNVNIAQIPDVGYNLTINAKNFNVLNSTQKQNELFFGKANIDANISVKGQGANSVVNGNLKVDPGSNITVVLPNDATEAGDASKGIIEFVDMSDSTRLVKMDTIATPQGINMGFASEISMDISVDDQSEFKVVIDELNGDNIRLKGNAQLNTGIAPNGQLFLLGSYDLTEGSYDLTLQILKRQFEILKGSNLIWTGDPMKADLNLTAGYTVEVDPGSIASKFQGASKVPIQVQVIITGNLTTPNITFNIVPGSGIDEQVKSDITAQTFWSDMQNNPSEMNKQAFALLITGKFITDQSSSGGFDLGASAEAVARQSVSQLLTDQLNNLASDLIKGVDLNIGLNSTADQTTGARTDLNVGLSKAFLNDRLKISVGKNFEIENQGNTPSSTEVVDNIALDYSITPDGRYLFRGYRKNQYQSILEGFIIETGVSFIITADYDLFREIFQKRRNEE
ncbi:translocation/assembly module TamB domain-containing protein [Dyadobacter sandarakinus]|uniref:Translocation/assembly module TamB domain-containing protein n=1 Tax=Dyadobacter sandarakinus TaxID=2747268 RepID=A0ABX7I7R5_9BACT|nr:translocation/assembly module TamB domain-containing protein [Dyadobacter sandarakinus]QRR02134.1 translocation/assembly module TamB domain-containing protein [Dyadobacter sandarakinus]